MLYLDPLDKAAESANNGLSKVHREAMEKNADTCVHYQLSTQNGSHKSCLYCVHLDSQVYSCKKLDKPVIPYEWI